MIFGKFVFSQLVFVDSLFQAGFSSLFPTSSLFPILQFSYLLKITLLFLNVTIAPATAMLQS